jgi:hypothetical protein
MAKPTIIKKFNSSGEFLEWASNAPCKWEDPESREKGDEDWHGTNTYPQAYKLAKFGWDDGLKRLSKQVKAAKKLVAPVTKRTRKYDVAGHFPNPARAAAGEPFAMVHKGRDFKQRPIVKIAVNFGYNADVDSERIMKWGAAICSYIDALEENGFTVEVSSNSQTKGYENHSLMFEFALKKAGSRMSMASMVFWLAHPASLRRIEFSAMERLDVEDYYGGSYGRAVNNLRSAPEELELFIDDSSNDLARDLETIRKKHLNVMERTPTQFQARDVVESFDFG